MFRVYFLEDREAFAETRMRFEVIPVQVERVREVAERDTGEAVPSSSTTLAAPVAGSNVRFKITSRGSFRCPTYT